MKVLVVGGAKPINSMKNKEHVELISGRGWVYFFSDTKPKRPINDWYLYYKKNTIHN